MNIGHLQRFLASRQSSYNPLYMGAKFFIYQIYYDAASKGALDPGFIPLNNSQNENSDWYEFWPMRNFLLDNSLDRDAWYGFLSPKFQEKTGLNSQYIKTLLNSFDLNADVALFSPGWDQLAYFQNPFEQGEVWHPGISQASQAIFNKIGVSINLDSLVTHSMTSVFSNYIVAKPKFWNEWLMIANKLYDLLEKGGLPESSLLTSYGSIANQAPMKAFIQERLASVVLSNSEFAVISPDFSQSAPIFERIFSNDPKTRRMLQTCDLLKENYCNTNDASFLEMYKKIRSEIRFRKPY